MRGQEPGAPEPVRTPAVCLLTNWKECQPSLICGGEEVVDPPGPRTVAAGNAPEGRVWDRVHPGAATEGAGAWWSPDQQGSGAPAGTACAAGVA